MTPHEQGKGLQYGIQARLEGEDLATTSRESRLIHLIAHLMLVCHDRHLREYVMRVLREEFGCVSLSYGLGYEDGKATQQSRVAEGRCTCCEQDKAGIPMGMHWIQPGCPGYKGKEWA